MLRASTLVSRPFMVVALLMAVIFFADVFVFRESNLSFFYLIAVIIGLFFKERNDVILIGMISTALTIVAVFFQPATDSPEQMLFARFASTVAIWTAASLVIKILTLRMEENMQDEQFHALFRFATNGIIIANSRGEIVRMNPAAEKLFGYDDGELLGKLVERLIPQRLHRMHERHRNDYKSDPKPRAMGIGLDLYAVKKDGSEFPIEVSLSPFKTMQGEFVMAFVIDNTIRKEHEQRIVRQNQKLEQLAGDLQSLNEGLEEKIRERTRALEQTKNDLADALEAERELGELKSRFVSMASHEFRTPLSTVLSSAALVNSYADRQDFENIRKHATKIKTAVNNLNTILTEFLSLGKLEEGKTVPVVQQMNLKAAVEEVASELKPLLKLGQTFEYTHQGAEMVYLDPGLMKHSLINLFSNAIKYSPEYAPIKVETVVAKRHVSVRIHDKGMGIPEADQKHLFSRFFRATNAVNIQGTGLGLYIVKRYVELMNGEISFESREGEGTTFWLNFETQDPAPADQ